MDFAAADVASAQDAHEATEDEHRGRILCCILLIKQMAAVICSMLCRCVMELCRCVAQAAGDIAARIAAVAMLLCLVVHGARSAASSARRP
eukprot:SAG11_NODE_1083_length_5951_cov_7.969925_3_plen_91_part_00